MKTKRTITDINREHIEACKALAKAQKHYAKAFKSIGPSMSSKTITRLKAMGGKVPPFWKRKPRKPLRKVSPRRSAEAKVYRERKKVFLGEHTHCFSCKRFVYGPLRDLHHTRGRAGSLYLDERFWVMLCRHCHDVVHTHQKWAVEEGLLAGAGEWNVSPR